MFEVVGNTGTFNLSGESITITKEMGARSISIVLISGTVTVKGLMKLGVRDSDAIVLGTNPLNLTFDYAIDGVTIDASAGVAEMVSGK